jgi:hypothetical protein
LSKHSEPDIQAFFGNTSVWADGLPLIGIC